MNGRPTSYMVDKDFDLLKSPKSIRPLHSLHINIDCLLSNHEYNLKGDFEAIQHAKNFKLAKQKLYVDYLKDDVINTVKTALHTPTVTQPLINIKCSLYLLDLFLDTTPMYQAQFKHNLKFETEHEACHDLVKSLEGTRFC